VAKAPPDGYTLLVGGASLWLMPLMQKVSYDVVKDFSPISLMREVAQHSCCALLAAGKVRKRADFPGQSQAGRS